MLNICFYIQVKKMYQEVSPCPLLWFHFPRFPLPMVSGGPEADDLSLTQHQKVTSSLILVPNAYAIHLTTSHQVGILSSNIITRRGVKYSKASIERPHSY